MTDVCTRRLHNVVDTAATPDLVPRGAMMLQPSEANGGVPGSHYTPRELTEPIVRKALEPVLGGVGGGRPCPNAAEQLLDLKICDPAMGSGAFLVEAMSAAGRQAGGIAWKRYTGADLSLPAGRGRESGLRETSWSRRSWPLYGVDRNPMAVDLAKMSLWLATLAQGRAPDLRGPRLAGWGFPGGADAASDSGVHVEARERFRRNWS